jgi:proliferating cell nuclear antigen PCNA
MLLAEFGPSLQFRQIMEALKEVLVFAQLRIDKTGLKLTSIGCSSSCLAHVVIPARACVSYHWRKDDILLCRVKVHDWVRAMKDSRKKYQNIIGMVLEDKQFIFKFYSQTTHETTLPNTTLSFTALKPSTCVIKTLPSKDNVSTLEMPSSELKRICIIASLLGKHSLEITLTPDGIDLVAIGTRSKYPLHIAPCNGTDQDPVLITMMHEVIRQQFPLRFLNFFNKASTLSDRVIGGFAPDRPCYVEYKMGEGSITYLLEPFVN